MQTFRNIDWGRAWTADRQQNSHGNNAEFWNRRAASFADHINERDNEDYIDPFLELIGARADWSVLDVGCGPGTLALPLARRARKVTALDFSSAMLGYLKERKEAAGITNIEEKLLGWEDDWREAGIEPHEVAVASRSLATDDPREALLKLIAHAKRRVCISFMVDHGPTDPRILEAVGRTPNITPDYIYIYNLLYQMGVRADVRMLERRLRDFADEQDAVESVRWMIHGITPSEEEALRRFIASRLVRNGDRWKIDYQRPVRWAAIYWNVAGNEL